MGHTFSMNHLHIVFSTKERRKIIARDCQPQLWAYLAGICQNHGMVPLSVGGTENHVHVLLNLPATMALAKAVLSLKANSSKWMSERGKPFAWQHKPVSQRSRAGLRCATPPGLGERRAAKGNKIRAPTSSASP